MRYRKKTAGVSLTPAEYHEVRRWARVQKVTVSAALRALVLPVIRRQLKKYQQTA